MVQAELEKNLKEEKLNSIYLLYGEETYLLDTAVKKIKKIFGEKVVGINYIELDEETISNLVQEIQMPCFGYPKKMIVVRHSGLFKKETKKKGVASVKETREELEKYLKENAEYVNENFILIFIEDSVEKLNITKTIEAIRREHLRI